MIVIIEGPDLAGKSYAIERIGKHFNSGFTLKNNYKPIDSATDKIYSQYWKILELAVTNDEENELIILDRFYPSQAVYSILRGFDMFEGDAIIELEKRSKTEGVKIIYLDTKLEVLEARYRLRGDEHIKLDQLKMLKERYDAFMAVSDVPVLYLDTSEKDWLKKVEKFLGMKGGNR